MSRLSSVFTAEERDRTRARLLERARADRRITGAALTGSAAHDAQDRWSDIDLFEGVMTIPDSKSEAGKRRRASAYAA